MTIKTLLPEGGQDYIDYEILNPVDGGQIKAESKAEWMADFDPLNPFGGVMVCELPAEDVAAGQNVAFEFSGLQPSTQYYFRIEALDRIHNRSALSEEVAAVTAANTPPVTEPVDGTRLVIAAHVTGSLKFNVLDYDGDPVSDTLWLRTPEKVYGASVEVKASNGAAVIRRNGLESSPFEPLGLDVSHIPGGIYYVRFSFTDSHGKHNEVTVPVAKL